MPEAMPAAESARARRPGDPRRLRAGEAEHELLADDLRELMSLAVWPKPFDSPCHADHAAEVLQYEGGESCFGLHGRQDWATGSLSAGAAALQGTGFLLSAAAPSALGGSIVCLRRPVAWPKASQMNRGTMRE